MTILAGTFEMDMQLIATVALLALLFLTGLVWSASVQLVRIAKALQKIADHLGRKDSG
jgi:hypothetical protein